MTAIRLHKHPMEAVPPLHVTAPSLGEWLLAHYGDRPSVEVHVYAGEPSRETDITGDVATILRSDAPLYVVLEAPGTGFELVPFLINLGVSAVIGYVAQSMFGPDTSTLDNRSQESPNNALSARENQVRAMQRVEDIFGTVRAIPSLIMQTYTKYVEHRQVEYGLLCIGRGYYEVTDMRDGDTAVSDISGSSAAVYAPFTSPNSGTPQLLIGDAIIDPVLNVSRSSAVEGIILKPVNQQQPEAGLAYFFRGPGPETTLPATTEDVIYQPTTPNSRRPNFSAIAAVGQTITLAMSNTLVNRLHDTAGLTAAAGPKTITSPVTGFFRGLVNGQSITFPGFTDPTNQTAKTVVSHTGETVTVSQTLVNETGAAVTGMTVDMLVNYSASRAITGVGNGYIVLSGVQFFQREAELLDANVTVNNALTDWTDWFTLPDLDRTEVWTNVVARGGMFKDDGAKSSASVTYEVQIERLDPDNAMIPTGEVETISGTLSGATSVERAETLEHVTAWVGPVRVRARRVTPFDFDFSGFVQDEITLVDLYAVAPVTKPHFGNKTTVHTVTRAVQGAAGSRRRQLNCLASRRLPTYNGTTFSGAFDSTGLLVSGTISATSRIVDILAAVTVDPKIGARPIADIDMAQVWSVQQALDAWHAEAGQFNYTFDTDTLSYEETVDAIADAAFCKPYRQNGQIRLALDRQQANAVALFTHRNKKPRSETITRRFISDSDYDGVELVYMDPDSDMQETIRLPSDGSAAKLKKVEVSGIRSFEQAWFRANREFKRLGLQRLSLETVCTTDARALLPNSRILNVDNTRFRSWDGEVVAQDGLELTLSRDVEFVPAVPHSIVLQKRDGSPQSIAVTAGSAANRVVIAAPPAEAIVTESSPEDGIRTVFSFAADSARAAQAWLVQEISPADEDGYVRVRAVNYADGYYAADELAVPAKSSVIN